MVSSRIRPASWMHALLKSLGWDVFSIEPIQPGSQLAARVELQGLARMAFFKSALLAASCGLAASLNAGDCAFVGIYGDQAAVELLWVCSPGGKG